MSSTDKSGESLSVLKEEKKIEENDDETRSESKPPWAEAHRIAVQNNQTTYTDPETSYIVMTELFHKQRGYCCGNNCRHCPYEFSIKQNLVKCTSITDKDIKIQEIQDMLAFYAK
ncbi:23334_t:CDS:2 [Dentiscutata erythropus]|uniref:23334_t:CDS:1 n=1 Tax=Dentiscutata erythropus TaxID=1348616 RepID=A0A9N9GNX5_9GLOM|nr:23334_t:CDS:2 [Dentiscutata erythropus]